MKHHPFLYSFKIWLVTGCIAPVPFLFDLLRNAKGIGFLFLATYPTLLLIGLVFSAPAWLVFWALSELIVRFVPDKLLRKSTLSFFGILLTIGTFYVFLQFWDMRSDGTMLVTIFFSAASAGIGSWFYYPAPRVYPPEDFPS